VVALARADGPAEGCTRRPAPGGVGAVIDEGKLADLVVRIEHLPLPAVIGVEGFTGSGKSHLADDLAARLSATAVHLDSFLPAPAGGSQPYVERLDLPALAAALQADPVVVVEGICLRDALDRIGGALDFAVYVRRISTVGLWHDGLDMDDFEAGQTVTRDEPERSDMLYHCARRPHTLADCVIDRRE
jgi:uridine kinase